MFKVPTYPAIRVQVADQHEDAFMRNCVAVRFETMIPMELVEKLSTIDELVVRIEAALKEITVQPDDKPMPVYAIAETQKEITDGR